MAQMRRTLNKQEATFPSEAPSSQLSRRTSEHRTMDPARTKPSRVFSKGPLTSTLWHGDSESELPGPAPAHAISLQPKREHRNTALTLGVRSAFLQVASPPA